MSDLRIENILAELIRRIGTEIVVLDSVHSMAARDACDDVCRALGNRIDLLGQFRDRADELTSNLQMLRIKEPKEAE